MVMPEYDSVSGQSLNDAVLVATFVVQLEPEYHIYYQVQWPSMCIIIFDIEILLLVKQLSPHIENQSKRGLGVITSFEKIFGKFFMSYSELLSKFGKISF